MGGGRHFESTQPVKDRDEGRGKGPPPFHTVLLSLSAIFLTRLRPLLVSLSKMSTDNSYQNKNTPALQVRLEFESTIFLTADLLGITTGSPNSHLSEVFFKEIRGKNNDT